VPSAAGVDVLWSGIEQVYLEGHPNRARIGPSRSAILPAMVQGKLLFLLAIQIALTAMPGAAVVFFAAGRGERRTPVLLALALLGSGVAAMLAFWAYYATHEIGQTVSFLILFGSVLSIAWQVWEGRIDWSALRPLLTPLALWALGSAFLVYFGFLHGGTGTVLSTSARRFSSQLPSDNDIPLFFSEWFFAHGHSGTPPIFPGEWLASDRPPLQVGYAMFTRTFGWDHEGLHYEILGVVLQQLWIVGVWALLVAAKAGRVTRALAVLTVLVSDVAIVNGFFVWPKLLPAAMLLAIGALVLTPLWDEVRGRTMGAVLIAGLAGLAMLGHGSSVFGLIPLALLAAYRGLPSWRWLGIAVLVGALFVVPWSAYQKYGDPPGNRLTKWMIGGVIEIDERGTMESVIDSYREAGAGGAIENKVDSFATMTGFSSGARGFEKAAFEALVHGNLRELVLYWRFVAFFFLLPSLGLLLFGLAAMLARLRVGVRNAAEWTLAVRCLLVTAMGAVVWGIVMFGGEEDTVIHAGSLAIPIFLTLAAAVGARSVFPRAGTCLLVVNAVLMLALSTPSIEPEPGTAYSGLNAIIAVLFFVGFCVVAFGMPWRGTAPAVVPPSVQIDSPS
jgi:hypothetical protein